MHIVLYFTSKPHPRTPQQSITQIYYACLLRLLGKDKMQHTVLLAIRNVDALPEGGHEGVQETALLLLVIVNPQQRLNSAGSLLGLVEGDPAEQVVNDMVVDDFVEEVAADEADAPVNGGKGTLGVGPGLGGVVGDSGVGVLQIGDCDYFSR